MLLQALFATSVFLDSCTAACYTGNSILLDTALHSDALSDARALAVRDRSVDR